MKTLIDTLWFWVFAGAVTFIVAVEYLVVACVLYSPLWLPIVVAIWLWGD